MVATTKGAVNAPSGDNATPQQRTDSDDRMAQRTLELDENTWGQVNALAQSQQTTPADVVRRTIENAYGVRPQEGAYHSGMPNDPALVDARPESMPATVGATPSERSEAANEQLRNAKGEASDDSGDSDAKAKHEREASAERNKRTASGKTAKTAKATKK